eukprot:TRINITY_DN570_c0_g1_i2.p1 TRINITY_DN570_c0_g1~~TRINITY_DN570_c0_g1_i2.p1  ORF type:complete len:564 (-),score=170.01 TRINITY_DN570_c0_g1_i2:49-1740(-)
MQLRDFLVLLLLLNLSMVVPILAQDDENDLDDMIFRYEHSFKAPYYVSGTSLPFWDFGGDTIITEDFIRLTSAQESLRGYLWNKKPVNFDDWSFILTFSIGSDQRGGADGLAAWYTEERGIIGDIFGNQDKWNGLGVFVDTFDNDNKRNNPEIYAVVNDGNLEFDKDNDGGSDKLGTCTLKVRSVPYNNPKKYNLKVSYIDGELEISTKSDASNNWKECFRTPLDLPKGYYFGVSAETGGLFDNHDLFSFETKSSKELEAAKNNENIGAGKNVPPVYRNVKKPSDKVPPAKDQYGIDRNPPARNRYENDGNPPARDEFDSQEIDGIEKENDNNGYEDRKYDRYQEENRYQDDDRNPPARNNRDDNRNPPARNQYDNRENDRYERENVRSNNDDSSSILSKLSSLEKTQDDILYKFRNIEDSINSLKTQMQDAQRSLTHIRKSGSDSRDYTGSIQELSRKSDELKGVVNTIDSRLNSVKSSVEGDSGKIISMEKRLEKMVDSKTTKKFRTLDKNLEALKNELAELIEVGQSGGWGIWVLIVLQIVLVAGYFIVKKINKDKEHRF